MAHRTGNLAYGINRTILECKLNFSVGKVVHDLVLIEPYWNVNRKKAASYMSKSLGINRTILECKFIHKIK